MQSPFSDVWTVSNLAWRWCEVKIFIGAKDKDCWMIQNVVKNFWIPCFIFELSTVLYDWLMTSFCLQKAKKVYKIYCNSREKSTQVFFNWNAFLNIVPIHEAIFMTSFSSNVMLLSTVAFQRSDTPIFLYTHLVIRKKNDVIHSYLKLVDNMKREWDINEI